LTILEDPDIESEISLTAPRCAGAHDGQINVNAITGGVPPYMFNVDGQSPISADLPLFVPAGLYEVIVEDRYGCMDIHNVEIQDPIPFVIDATGENHIVLGHSTILTVTGNYAITALLWDPGDRLDCNTCLSTFAAPVSNTIYIATATSEQGCIALDSLLITVDTDPRVFIPNIFTPNGDNVNDTWGIHADPLNVIAIEQLVIFDRWGNVLKEISGMPLLNAQVLWDGRHANGFVGGGVYVYLIALRMANDEVVRLSGSITVLR
jgi:gliding motility-associated-like protein